MSNVDTKKLRALAERATPGPWRWGESDKERRGVPERMMNLYSDAPRPDGDVRIIPIIWLEPSSGWNTLHDNTEWIAAANPQAVLALLDRLADAEAERDDFAARWEADGAKLEDLAARLAAMTAARDEQHVLLTTERDQLREQLELATDAIDYALDRVGRDPEFAYHMLFTETLDQLIRASARISGRDPVLVREEIMKRTAELPQSRCAADKEFIDGGGAHGDI